MEKRIIGRKVRRSGTTTGDWLELEDLAKVEVTSEDPSHPVEQALVPGGVGGWRASEPGEQIITLVFTRPLSVRKIRLVFREEKVPRTQEFVVRWSSDHIVSRETVRQQFNFSPPGTSEEVEEYSVDMPNVAAIDLIIRPDDRGEAYASLEEWRIA